MEQDDGYFGLSLLSDLYTPVKHLKSLTILFAYISAQYVKGVLVSGQALVLVGGHALVLVGGHALVLVAVTLILNV